MSTDEPGWPRFLAYVQLEGSDKPVRVVLDGREGNQVFLRQADPADGDPSAVEIHQGEELVVMQAIAAIGHHLDDEVGSVGGFLYSTRVVPVRREHGQVFARTLSRDEPDTGQRVHVRPGETLAFEPGAIVAELDAIDDFERGEAEGYVPITPVLWTWLRFGSQLPAATVRYLLSAARRLDAAHVLLQDVEALRTRLNEQDLPGPALRQAVFRLVGAVELAVVALGRVIDMIIRARKLLGTAVPAPPTIAAKSSAITDIRHAYEHIEDRALGQVREKPDSRALTIFDQTKLLTDDVITYADHTLHLREEVPTLLAEARQFLKDIAANPLPA